MHEAPHAPWALRGEVVVAAASGPVFVYGVRYTDSPVGPYLEFGVAVPARIGLRPGLRSVLVVVSDAAAKVGCRLNWGLPAELGRLTWSVDGDERVLRWEERGVELRAVPVGVRVPAWLPVRGVQRRGDGPVLVPRRVTAMLRFARVSVSVGESVGGDGVAGDDALAGLAGRHGGAVLTGARLLMRPARHPSGVLSSFRAPLREIEPGLSYRAESAVSSGGRIARHGAQIVLQNEPSPIGSDRGGATVNGPGRMAQLVRAQPSHG